MTGIGCIPAGNKIRLVGGNFSDVVASAIDHGVQYRLKLAGDERWYKTSTDTETTIGKWHSKATSSDKYQFRATLNSGSVDIGPVDGAWRDFGAVEWYWVAFRFAGEGIGSQTADLTIDIRHKDTQVILATANVILTAQRTA